MDFVLLLGRILFGALFLGSHGALDPDCSHGRVRRLRGVPMAALAARATGVQIAVGGSMVILGLWGDLCAILLVAFLLGTAFLMHPFWKESDAANKQVEMVHFNKELGLAGGALAFVCAFAQDVGLPLTGPLLF